MYSQSGISNKWSTSSEDEEELQPLKTSKPLIVLTSKSPVKKTYSANASPYSDYYRRFETNLISFYLFFLFVLIRIYIIHVQILKVQSGPSFFRK